MSYKESALLFIKTTSIFAKKEGNDGGGILCEGVYLTVR